MRFCSPFPFLSLPFSFLLLSSLPLPYLFSSLSLPCVFSPPLPFLSLLFLLFVFRELESIFAKDLYSPCQTRKRTSGGGNGQEASLAFKEVNEGPARIRDLIWFRWIHSPFLFCFLEKSPLVDYAFWLISGKNQADLTEIVWLFELPGHPPSLDLR